MDNSNNSDLYYFRHDEIDPVFREFVALILLLLLFPGDRLEIRHGILAGIIFVTSMYSVRGILRR